MDLLSISSVKSERSSSSNSSWIIALITCAAGHVYSQIFKCSSISRIMKKDTR
ncbi:uncharacterized protein BJX67DRAFT_350642 [Aspergillus lucknowensis]|uniref:Uncharacterized protein n=1 Tax=Aspergillus lucknowensis TaxID=176173 RepID=A0ABR4LV70_9EURO